ncbi:Lsr2 family protein (plasmid) [Embleya sp. NBC_00888]|uniref:histone-like nucleoid-structuring protein Lsr2 n=1 Tax=Embleya sp. NBC_00888 TaxID=2975960 RepID=UPI002F90F316|nr:Lsr2 family protein [Embleya sp. NBC_00888]
MARRVITEYVDDITGKSDGEVKPHTFAVDGVHYEIDLNGENYQALLDRLGPYFQAARKTSSRSRTQGKRAQVTSHGRPDPVAVREWAKDQGIAVNARGRVPLDVVRQYTAAQ